MKCIVVDPTGLSLAKQKLPSGTPADVADVAGVPNRHREPLEAAVGRVLLETCRL